MDGNAGDTALINELHHCAVICDKYVQSFSFTTWIIQPTIEAAYEEIGNIPIITARYTAPPFAFQIGGWALWTRTGQNALLKTSLAADG